MPTLKSFIVEGKLNIIRLLKQKSVQDIASLFGEPNSTLDEIQTTGSNDGDNVS